MGFASTLNLRLSEVAVGVRPHAVGFSGSGQRHPPDAHVSGYNDQGRQESGNDSAMEGEEPPFHTGDRHSSLQGGSAPGQAATHEPVAATYDQYKHLIDFNPLAFSSFTQNLRERNMNQCWTDTNQHPRGARYGVKAGPHANDNIFVMPTGPISDQPTVNQIAAQDFLALNSAHISRPFMRNG